MLIYFPLCFYPGRGIINAFEKMVDILIHTNLEKDITRKKDIVTYLHDLLKVINVEIGSRTVVPYNDYYFERK